jgi:hypothetical protein
VTIQHRFESFHAHNPQVMRLLESLTEEWISTGHTKLAIGMLWENMRWRYTLATADPDTRSGYKLNDHYRSRYVRLLIERHPEWEYLFSLRELRTP